MTAARTCSATSASFVAASSGEVTDGTHDSAVSATAVWRKRRRAERLRRLSTARSTPPMMAPRAVIWVKPASGIISPSTSNETPAAWNAAAAPVVAAAATRPATTVVRRSDIAERVVADREALSMWVVVRDIVSSLSLRSFEVVVIAQQLTYYMFIKSRGYAGPV